MSDERRAGPELLKGLWRENPVFVAVLGLCPAMAVTNSLRNGLVMGFATAFVLASGSAHAVSYGDFEGTNVRFESVQDQSGLYGTPLVSGDSLVFLSRATRGG